MEKRSIFNAKAELNIDLYHGTSTLFLDSIVENGLGGINPVRDWNLLELAKEVFEQSKLYLEETEIFQKSCWSFENMVNQKVYENSNWQHGDTYLSPSIQTAVNYAIDKEYGSELFTYTLLFLKELTDRKIQYVIRDLYQRFPKMFQLINARPAPVLISASRISLTGLLNEHGEIPIENFIRLEKSFVERPDDYQKRNGQNNFRLSGPIPVQQLKFYIVNITQWNIHQPVYNLYEIKIPNIGGHKDFD